MAKNKMEPIKWKDDCEFVWQALGLEESRSDELEYRMKLILHETFKPLRKGEEYPNSDIILKLFIALAENHIELIYCSYLAGTKISDYYETNEPEFWDEEE